MSATDQRYTHRGLALALLLTVAASCGHASDDASDNPYVWDSKISSVSVFKNGMGFFTREGEVKLRDGWCTVSEIPPASFGTLAIYSHDKEHGVDVVGSGPGEIVDFDDDTARRERLEASMQLKLELTYTYRESKRKSAGKLVSVGPEFVVLDAGKQSLAVPIKDVTRMQILDLPVRVHLQDQKGAAPKSTTLGMAYLRKGVTWLPEYTVTIIDDETAELSLRGTLVNEAEDLVDCDVNFVVGVPHFVHTDYLAPIAVGQTIRTIGAAVAPREIQSQIMNRAAFVANSMTADQFGGTPSVTERAVSAGGGNLDGIVGSLPQMSGSSATDYTVYTKKNLTVRRGEKAIVTLFSKTIRYSHVYRWSPPGRIKHMFVLHNGTDTAWTTGPYIALSNGRPLSEDLLRYTPKSGRCEIPVTDAINISHEKSESEIDRKLKAHSPSHNRYLDLVTLQGTLKLRNFEKRNVDVILSVPVSGKPASASDEGTLHANSSLLTLSKRAGTVAWRLTLKPGETRSLTYTYERYVSSG
jgi:hypothetical protein